MELKANDLYRIECQDSIAANELFSLSILYSPFLSSLALQLYYFLVAEANQVDISLTHDRICTILNQNIVDIENARGQLEELLLLKTFCRHEDEVDYYIYQVCMPLLPNDFLKHDVFGRMYAQAVGLQQYEITKQMCMHPGVQKENFVDVSKPFQNRFLTSWNKEKEEEFHRIRPNSDGKYEISDLQINFDYDAFLQDLSFLAVPASARTKQSLKVIGELATVYGIDPKRMGVLVSRCIDLKDKTLDEQKLRSRCRSEKSAYVNPNTPKTKYDVAPVQFLKNIQNGVAVTAADTKLLEDLVRNMKLSPSVVNVLVEYVLKTYDMKLSRSVTEKIAASWVRLRIDSVEDALTLIQSQSIKKKQTKEKALPQWYSEEQPQENTTDDKEKEELLRKIQSMKGGF